MPSVSKDNTKLAFTQLSQKNPAVILYSLETNRKLPFVNPQASVNSSADFTPDGQNIIFSSSLGAGFANLFMAGIDGSGIRRLTSVRAVETEPKVNPKTGREVVFTSGRSGPPQLYKMSIDGADIERLTSGEGDAVNPSWHPEGQLITFSWTRGFEPGNFNIFVMDVTKKEYIQLTHGVGRNENPTWAPDGRHIVFCSNRSGTPQIWTMLADGTQVKRLTSQGSNTMPVWSK
jgi:TolB protein